MRRKFLSVSLALAACCAAGSVATATAVTLPPPPAGQVSSDPVILVLGDSLSAEYGLQRGQGWVQLLANRLQQSGMKYSVVNASISGETTSGGRTRLPALLKRHRPSIVIIELGGNDGLRGLPVSRMQENLVAMVRASQAAGARVLLAGIRMPPNYGRDYTERFFEAYAAVAKQYKTALVPFLLEGFAESAEFFQPDRIHPSAQAQATILQTVLPVLDPMLTKKAQR